MGRPHDARHGHDRAELPGLASPVRRAARAPAPAPTTERHDSLLGLDPGSGDPRGPLLRGPASALGRDFDPSVLPTNRNLNTLNANTTFRAFQAELEGLHGLVHNAVGGTMATASSPADPLFWLHHSFVDRLWARWQASPQGAPPPNPNERLLPARAFGSPLVRKSSLDRPRRCGARLPVRLSRDTASQRVWSARGREHNQRRRPAGIRSRTQARACARGRIQASLRVSPSETSFERARQA